MSPAATKASKPDIVLLANAKGEVKEVKPKAEAKKAETKKAPARRRASRASAKDLSAAADELLAAADQAKKAEAGTTKKAAAKKTTAKKATTKKAATKKDAEKKPAAKKATTKKAAAKKDAAPAKPEIVLSPEEKAKAIAAEKAAKAKALASIKIGPKGVYEDSIGVYLQEIGRIRLLRPDEEIELARKIADLLHLEELAAQLKATTVGARQQRVGGPGGNAPDPLPPRDAGSTGQRKNGAVEPAPGGLDREEIHESRLELSGFDSGGQPRIDPCR